MDLVVGTFTSPHLFTLRFTPPLHTSTSSSTAGALTILRRSPAIGSHSWLALSRDKKYLYATAWTEPPSIAAYAVTSTGPQLINNQVIRNRSAYVTCSETHIYSAGGVTGEVFAIRDDGGIGELVQELSFLEDQKSDADAAAEGKSRPHGDFGGLRHGAHSVDLSREGDALYVADIGRNCVWAYTVQQANGVWADESPPHLKLGSKNVAPRANDGPRHSIPHPNGRVLYSLQEHTSMVDVFRVWDDRVTLEHVRGVKVLPEGKEAKDFWADEVRLSATETPKYLYASNRGLKAGTKGYVGVWRLTEEGMVDGAALDIYETATSGGWANAVEPAPPSEDGDGGVEYLALTDSEECWVFVLAFDGKKISEVAKVKLGGDDDEIVGAATAVWL